MSHPLAEQLRTARLFDLEQPRFRGMPIHPAHQPGYFYALHRRHGDTYRPEANGPGDGWGSASICALTPATPTAGRWST